MGYFGYDQGGVGQLFTLALAQQCLWQFWSVPHSANSCDGACPSRPVGAQFWRSLRLIWAQMALSPSPFEALCTGLSPKVTLLLQSWLQQSVGSPLSAQAVV